MLIHSILSVLLTVLSVPSLGGTYSTVPVATVRKGNTAFATAIDLRVGSAVVATSLVPASWLGPQSGESSLLSDQTLTTSIQDPGNADEPWVVTTHRRSGESQSAFIKRHMEMVHAVRDALGLGGRR